MMPDARVPLFLTEVVMVAVEPGVVGSVVEVITTEKLGAASTATGQRAPTAPSKRTSVRSDWTREARCICASPVWVRVMCRRSRTRDRAFVEQERCHRVRVNDAEWLG